MIKKQFAELEQRLRDVAVKAATSPADTTSEVAELKMRVFTDLTDIGRELMRLTFDCERCASCPGVTWTNGLD